MGYILTGNVNYHERWHGNASLGTDYNHAAFHYGIRWDKANERKHTGE